MQKRKNKRQSKATRKNNYTVIIILVTVISLSVFGFSKSDLKISNSDNITRQFEKECAYSFCALKVIETINAPDPSTPKYWYQTAQAFERGIKNPKKIQGVKNQMEKVWWGSQ